MVRKLIKRFNTRNPIIIAKNLGIIILYEELGSIKGYYNTAYKQKFIHVNSNLTKHEQQFTIAHELGHALLHPKSNTPFLKENTYFSVDKLEKEANAFAMQLLICDDELKEYYHCNTEQLSRIFGYHENLIHLRLLNFNFTERGMNYDNG